MYPGVSPSSALNLVLVAGELALVGGVSSEPHWVEVSAGHLPVYPGVSPSSALTLVLVAGELALVGGVSSEPHWVEVSAGHLPVYPGVSPSSALTLVLVAGELALVGGVSSEPHWVELWWAGVLRTSLGEVSRPPRSAGVSPSSALTLVLVAGELALVGGVSSEPHWVEVSAGHLPVYPGVSPSSALTLVLVAGELALVGGVSSEPHWVEVSAGHLPVYPGVSPSSALTLVLVAGELALVGGVSSEPHWVEVSAGHLPVYPGVSPSSALTLVLVAGELALVGGVSSEPHWVEVSAGHLPVYPGVSPSSALTLVLVAGELALVGGVSSEPHWVEVSAGHLLVYPGVSPSSAPVWRLPLRHLNLQPAASGRPRGFSLSRHGETVPIATFQWLGYLALTQEARVRFPVPEVNFCTKSVLTRHWCDLGERPFELPVSVVNTERAVRKRVDATLVRPRRYPFNSPSVLSTQVRYKYIAHRMRVLTRHWCDLGERPFELPVSVVNTESVLTRHWCDLGERPFELPVSVVNTERAVRKRVDATLVRPRRYPLNSPSVLSTQVRYKYIAHRMRERRESVLTRHWLRPRRYPLNSPSVLSTQVRYKYIVHRMRKRVDATLVRPRRDPLNLLSVLSQYYSCAVTDSDICHSHSFCWHTQCDLSPELICDLTQLGSTTRVLLQSTSELSICSPVSGHRVPLQLSLTRVMMTINWRQNGDLAGACVEKAGRDAVDNELDYSRWVKTLAAELLKQTPLEAVKFLDILGITATIPGDPDRSLSPEYHSEPENRSWELRCSPPSQECRKPSVPLSVPKNWYQRSVESDQPLSLIITEEPKKECRRTSFRKALNFDTVSEDVIDGFRVMDSICQLAKQSKNCFRTCNKSGIDNVPKCNEESVGKNRFKSLLKTFLSQESTKGVTSSGPLHTLDMKDDGRTGRPPLPDVVKDLPPCDRRSRARTRTPTPLRLRGKSVDVLPSTEDSRVAELMARCQQEDRYVPVRDKRLMFESLGRASSQPRFVLSSDNLMSLGDLTPTSEPPRTQSLHDLSANSVAVKEICRYFEQRGESRGELATRSPSPECRLRLHAPKPAKSLGEETLRGRQMVRAERRLGRLRQNIAECEQTIWRLRGQSSKLSQNRRELLFIPRVYANVSTAAAASRISLDIAHLCYPLLSPPPSVPRSGTVVSVVLVESSCLYLGFTPTLVLQLQRVGYPSTLP
ncbi:hypothetical protein J6590_078825 [Homalodisca vitripennis]|nr:hypothetical protein J6590_078825 [Homalodisca vitripennis]